MSVSYSAAMGIKEMGSTLLDIWQATPTQNVYYALLIAS